MAIKYTKELLSPIIAKSYTWREVCEHFGVNTHGGTQAHIKKRAIAFGIDFSHFKSRAWNKGMIRSEIRTTPNQVLTLRTSGRRRRGYMLTRCMQEMGVEYCCAVCGLINWMGKSLIFDVDHINGDPLDDRLENLRFLCQNCHAQTPTYKSKNRGRTDIGASHCLENSRGLKTSGGSTPSPSAINSKPSMDLQIRQEDWNHIP